jgi:CheY-like chemotaxis protein
MSQLRFLVVDDAAFIRDLLKKSLRNCFPGCLVIDVNSAPKAQAALKTQIFDLILCDWEMPEMTGEDFLRWIRASENYQQMPFIMVTSRGEKDYIVKAVQAGVSDYIGKPFTPETLQTRVTRTLKKAGIAIPGFNRGGTTQGIANASVSVLTGGATISPSSAPPAASAISTAAAGAMAAFGGKKETPKAAPAKTTARGQAQINFASGYIAQSVVRDISLQRLNCLVKREDKLPQILENVVVSIVENEGASVARLNGYVHSIVAMENSIDSSALQLIIRFVDDDPEKLDLLSRYIEKL